MRNLKKITVLLLLATFCVSSILNPSTAQIDEEVDWDYSGFIDKQTDRKAFDSSSPEKLRYIYHLFSNVETGAIEQIVVLYGSRPIISAPYYSSFFDEAATGTSYSYWINDTLDMNWVNISYEMVTNPNDEDYDLQYLDVYNEITNDSLLRTRSDIHVFDPTNSRRLILDITFANLSSIQGDVGRWKIDRKDGTIIEGRFTTYGDENPIFTEEKSGSVWPEYNITIAQNLFRSANPRTHSFEVDFSVGGVLVLGILYGILSIKAKHTRRNKK